MGFTQGHTGILSTSKPESREAFVMQEDTSVTMRCNFYHLVNLAVFVLQGFGEIISFVQFGQRG